MQSARATDNHGTDVFKGETVTAWADTTDDTVTIVNFTWKLEETVMRTMNITEWTEWTTDGVPGVEDGTTVYQFTDSYEPNEIGDWSVKAIFYNGFGQTVGSAQDSFPMRATSFFVIPEAVIGTIAIVLAMFGALGLFTIKKKRISIRTRLLG